MSNIAAFSIPGPSLNPAPGASAAGGLGLGGLGVADGVAADQSTFANFVDGEGNPFQLNSNGTGANFAQNQSQNPQLAFLQTLQSNLVGDRNLGAGETLGETVLSELADGSALTDLSLLEELPVDEALPEVVTDLLTDSEVGAALLPNGNALPSSQLGNAAVDDLLITNTGRSNGSAGLPNSPLPGLGEPLGPNAGQLSGGADLGQSAGVREALLSGTAPGRSDFQIPGLTNVEGEAELPPGLNLAAANGQGENTGNPVPQSASNLADDGLFGQGSRFANGAESNTFSLLNGTSEPGTNTSNTNAAQQAATSLNPGLANLLADATAPLQQAALNQQAQQQAGNAPLAQFSQSAVPEETFPALTAQISRNIAAGRDEFRLQLNPADLGRVDVRLSSGEDGSVNARVIVERPETLDLFQRDLRGLERALQQSGLRLNAEGVDLLLQDNGAEGGQDSGGFADNFGSDDERGEGQEDHDLAGNSVAESVLVDDVDVSVPAEAAQAIYARIQPGRLNIQV